LRSQEVQTLRTEGLAELPTPDEINKGQAIRNRATARGIEIFLALGIVSSSCRIANVTVH
jgi:hypothetical protein